MVIPDCQEICWYTDCADCPTCAHVINYRRIQQAEAILAHCLEWSRENREGRRCPRGS